MGRPPSSVLAEPLSRLRVRSLFSRHTVASSRGPLSGCRRHVGVPLSGTDPLPRVSRRQTPSQFTPNGPLDRVRGERVTRVDVKFVKWDTPTLRSHPNSTGPVCLDFPGEVPLLSRPLPVSGVPVGTWGSTPCDSNQGVGRLSGRNRSRDLSDRISRTRSLCFLVSDPPN